MGYLEPIPGTPDSLQPRLVALIKVYESPGRQTMVVVSSWTFRRSGVSLRDELRRRQHRSLGRGSPRQPSLPESPIWVVYHLG